MYTLSRTDTGIWVPDISGIGHTLPHATRHEVQGAKVTFITPTHITKLFLFGLTPATQ